MVLLLTVDLFLDCFLCRFFSCTGSSKKCKVFTLLPSFSLITIELEPDILYIKGVLNDSCDGL